MYKVSCHMRDADEGVFTKKYIQIEEGPVSLKLWETDSSWNVVPLSSMWFYFVEIVE